MNQIMYLKINTGCTHKAAAPSVSLPKGTRANAGPSPDSPVKINSSVGAGGANLKVDVIQIQRALNHVLPELYGAKPFLKDDGIVGPRTLEAIQKFQHRNLGFSDSRIDPKGKTLALINHYLATQPKPGDSHSYQDRVSRAVARLRSCSQTLLSAETKLQSLRPTLLGNGLTGGLQSLASNAEANLALLERHFKFSQVINKPVVLDGMTRQFQNMRSVIARSVPATGTLTNPNVDNLFSYFLGEGAFLLDPVDDEAVAYTSLGGSRMAGETRPDGRRSDRIYLCKTLDRASDEFYEETVIHELAHFTSPNAPSILDHGYGWINDPRMTPLTASARLCNAQNYATFAIESRYGKRDNRLGL